ncbi:stage II sporulation protein B [Cytobacillus sp. FJAT-53684]|uniref:Stage II sporulation protein B n=1 Tax=Cytobacillus mangrovibacter TaxID=3299024 RepID=A0ABW6JY99_9BACI
MDGKENGKTVTIKINGKNHTFKETESIESDRLAAKGNSEQSSEHFPKEGAYFSSIEAAASKETAEDDQFDWILPDESSASDVEVKEYQIAKQPRKTNKKGMGNFSNSLKKNKKNGLLSRMFLTVFFAILLGTSFGLLLLKLVITENETATEQPVVAQPAPEETNNQPEGAETIALEPLSTFVVQGGVFSSKEAAEQIKETAIQMGAPAEVVEINGQATLYLSVADNIEHAKEIGTQLKNKGLEVFAKPISFDGKSLDNLQGEEKQILEAAQAIYQSFTIGASEAASSMSISAPTLENIEKQSEALNGIKGDSLKHEGVIALKGELDQALQQLDSYKQTPDQTTLTKLQQHLLSFLAVYHSL